MMVVRSVLAPRSGASVPPFHESVEQTCREGKEGETQGDQEGEARRNGVERFGRPCTGKGALQGRPG